MKIAGFDWDLGNRAKCAKHGVTVAEIEGLFRGPVSVFPDPAHSTTEERFKAIGRTEAGRMVFLVFTLRTLRERTLIRPISARYMHRKEIAAYEEEAAKAGK
ncbi:BrnT family toxin [Rhodopseudomonas sp. BR0C11]|uniref:BrnT family toxin n=1 Tax=unclassified Rhodopseudomonas TaxID=2638247 RepID=UPI0013DEBC0F|nr:BrnT family toxin [Rhodopseudomonas sp. BR0C11]NEV76441.1 BrnT family toxin [Rhodopseudomonas sp. BR0C11]